MLLLCGLLLLTLAIAVLNILVPFWLAHENLPIWQVGVVSPSYLTDNLAGTLLTGYSIKHLDFNHSYHIASLIFVIGCVGLGIMMGFWSWMTWCSIAGVGCTMIRVAVESVLMCSGMSRNRGRLLAAYMMIHYMGTFLGQLLVSKVSTELMNVLPWVMDTILAGVLPLLFTRIANQQGDGQQSTPIVSMLRLRQVYLGVNDCTIPRIVLGSLYGLMPLYLNHQGMSSASIGFWMAVLVSVGILGQWSIGCLVDKLGCLLVLHIQTSVVIVGSVAMLSQVAMAPALLILGAAGFTPYPIAMAWTCEKVEHHQLIAMNQVLLLGYTVGSLLGSSSTATLMQNYSDSLPFIMIAGVLFTYLLMLLRKAGHTSDFIVHI